MALRALQRRVRPGQRESRGRVIEGRVAPGCGGVALLASRREVRLYVIRIRRSVEIRLVATHARGVRSGQVVVAIHVTLRTLQRSVRPSKRESCCRVIERRVPPRRGGVALLTRLREVRLHVIRIGRSLEIRLVAADAGCVRAGQVVIAIHVTLCALERRMRAGQRESRGRVIEGRITPRRRVVALLACRREVRLYVIRIRRSVEIRLVAADACGVGTGQVVIVVHVALRASHGRVSARQRETGRRVIERRVIPRRSVVALLAGLRESRTDVIRIRRSLEIFQVAAHASCRRQVVVIVDVALSTLQSRVRTGEREPCVVVIKGGLCPRCCVVALLASLREP